MPKFNLNINDPSRQHALSGLSYSYPDAVTPRFTEGYACLVVRISIRVEACSNRPSSDIQRRSPTIVAALSRRRGVAHGISSRRYHSSTSLPPLLSPTHTATLSQWISAEKQLEFYDTLRPEHLADLYITLPTRDGSHLQHPYAPPREGDKLGYGHHLVFFHPRNSEKVLRSDGTDVDFCPPEPFTRRMWAGGKITWKHPLSVGDKAVAVATIAAVDKKGFETGTPMVFVKQKIEYRKMGDEAVCVEEERSHVYLASAGNRRGAREVQDLPPPDFTFEYLPTPTTLFRFSALTFNGHCIHLDKEYAQKSEGYPERLVHGPLTALMLLDTAASRFPAAAFETFEYRAVNPIVVSRPLRICGAREGERMLQVWAEETETQVVGMTGRITLANV